MVLGFLLALLTVENTSLKRVTRTIVFLPVVIGLPSSSLLWFWLLDEQVGKLAVWPGAPSAEGGDELLAGDQAGVQGEEPE